MPGADIPARHGITAIGLDRAADHRGRVAASRASLPEGIGAAARLRNGSGNRFGPWPRR